MSTPTNVKYYAHSKRVPATAKVVAAAQRGAGAGQAERKVERYLSSVDDAAFGDLAVVQSRNKTNRSWTDVSAVEGLGAGKEIWVRARVENVRGTGKSCFVVLRQGLHTLQATRFLVAEKSTVQDKDLIAFIRKIPAESVVDVFGVLVKADVKSTTVKSVELTISRFYVVNAAVSLLPFQLADAARPEGDNKEEQITVGMDVRLNNRWIDLRTPANHAIFTLQSRVGQYFREFLTKNGFVEIHSPKLTPGVSEGGSAVFRLNYFNEKACLAQSPQLFKQMSVLSDLFKVFEVGPVFRAENSFTHRHLCEFTGLDLEMDIKEHYHEVLEVLWQLFVYIFDNINQHCTTELDMINRQFPFKPLQYRREPLIISFKDAIKLLREQGIKTGDLEDFSTPNEKLLGKLVKEKYGVDFYIIDKYPSSARPFYTMPCPTDSQYSNSYDVFLRGEEITSGSQRVHDVSLLQNRAEECNIPFSNIAKYLESFKYGAWPHGGAGIGLERVVMLFCGLPDIRMSSLFPRDPKRLAP